MPVKTDISALPESNDVIQTFKVWLSTYYGVDIIGTGKYFDRETSSFDSTQLRDVQLFISAIVSAHDTLADETGNTRLVGKRGRKAGDAVVKIETAEDVMKRLTRK